MQPRHAASTPKRAHRGDTEGMPATHVAVNINGLNHKQLDSGGFHATPGARHGHGPDDKRPGPHRRRRRWRCDLGDGAPLHQQRGAEHQPGGLHTHQPRGLQRGAGKRELRCLRCAHADSYAGERIRGDLSTQRGPRRQPERGDRGGGDDACAHRLGHPHS